MKSSDSKKVDTDLLIAPLVPQPQKRRLHRIGTVRKQQGMSLRTASRRLDRHIMEIRSMEKETSDMKLSTLYEW